MKSLREKESAIINELKDKLTHASLSILTDFRGLNVKEITQLRSMLREKGAEYKVVKNTLTRLAIKDTQLSSLEEYLTGPTALALDLKDPVSIAKVILDFSKNYKNIEIKAGILQGQIIKPDKIKDLANLPSKQELLGKLIGAINSPLVNLVFVLSSPIRGFIHCLNMIKEQKEKG
jgi:large subunit ribosomal protein L10